MPWTYRPIPGYQFVMRIEDEGGMILVASRIIQGQEAEARRVLTLAAAEHAALEAILKVMKPGNFDGKDPIMDDGSAGGEYSRTIEPDSANAILILAAPDMYEALEFVKAFFTKLEGDDWGDPLRAMRAKYHAPVHAKIDAALAKARGEAT